MTETGATMVAMGVLGALFGSFLNVCVARWPTGESVVAPRSRCPRCGRMIRWYENVPVLSWLALRARCAGCGLPISWQYPLVELTVAAAWAASAWLAGPGLLAFRLAAFATILLGIALTDLQTYTIPDGFTVSGLVLGLLGALGGALQDFQGPFASFPDAILGACVGAGSIAIVGWLGEALLKREAMGFGDVTLMAMVGVHVGPWRALMTVIAGAVIGLAATLVILLPLVGWRRATGRPPLAPPPVAEGEEPLPAAGWLGLPPIPFGVFLAPAALVVLLWGEALVQWYTSHFLVP